MVIGVAVKGHWNSAGRGFCPDKPGWTGYCWIERSKGMNQPACIPMLKALADETRWRLVRELLKGPRTVGGLTQRLAVTQYNVSKHLRILREAGIVETRKDGKHVECSVAEDFRRQIARKKDGLDLGCCT